MATAKRWNGVSVATLFTTLKGLAVVGVAAGVLPSCAQGSSEDYRAARAHFETKLAHQQPAPQDGDPLRAPAGALQVEYEANPALQAWISPAAQQATAKKPAVLFLHGGFAAGEDDWRMTQPYRDAGFVVMMPILRGENGQPGAYSMFYNEVTDVLSAANYLAQQPGVDATHLYLARHSVGGTLTLLAAMTGDKFRAATSFSGAPDVRAWAEPQPGIIPFEPSDSREFEMRSPLQFAGSFKCPTRICCGTQEKWCLVPSQRLADLARQDKLDVEAVAVAGDHFSAVPEEIQRSIAFFQTI